MKRIILVVLLLLATAIFAAVPSKAQNSFYSDRALSPQSVIGIPQPVAAPIPYGSVRVCSLPLTQQQPCLPLATITDINGVTLSNAIGSNFGQLTTDATGRYTFGCTPGVNYQVQITQSASNTPAVNYPITCPGAFGPGGLAGNLAFTGNNSHSGAETFANINKVIYADQQAGATADVKIANCLTALAGSGTCDARGFGATTQSLAAQVTVNSGQTLLFDPATVFQASTAALNPFVVKTNAVVSGLHFDCGNQPGYSGSIFNFNDSNGYHDGNTTSIINSYVTCNGVTTGNAFLLGATSPTASISFISIEHARVFGLNNGILFTATGNGFVNGNHIVDFLADNTVTGLHFTNNNGQLNGNICSPCSYEATISGHGVNAILYDGTTGTNDTAGNNQFYGDIWDTTSGNGIVYTNTKASGNIFFGLAPTNTVTDSLSNNIFFTMTPNPTWSGQQSVFNSRVNAPVYNTLSNCSSSASPAVCGSSSSGSVAIAAGATTVTVNTTAMTANSQIQLTFDSSLGTKLGITCNTTTVLPTVSARIGGTSFTITVPTAPVTNPACFSYTIIN